MESIRTDCITNIGERTSKNIALIFTGEHDARVPLKSVEKMSSNFASDARFHVFDAGHRPFIETHPEKWKSLIFGFLYNPPD